MSRLTSCATGVLGAGRVAFAAGLAFAPERSASRWLGPAVGRPPLQVALRGLAARDALAGAGLLLALSRRRPARPWLMMGALGDLADLAATLPAGGGLPPRARPGTIALAGGSAVLGVGLALARPRGG